MSSTKRARDEQGTTTLKVKRLVPEAVIPTRGSQSAAGYDLSSSESMVIPPGGFLPVPTGIAVAVPDGHYGRLAPRSGLALRNGIDVGAGVIDSDYRGPIKVILFNHGPQAFNISPGDRIAQLLIIPVFNPPVEAVDELDETVRGEGGFGSTGVATKTS